jgi:hypothetical protein
MAAVTSELAAIYPQTVEAAKVARRYDRLARNLGLAINGMILAIFIAIILGWGYLTGQPGGPAVVGVMLLILYSIILYNTWPRRYQFTTRTDGGWEEDPLKTPLDQNYSLAGSLGKFTTTRQHATLAVVLLGMQQRAGALNLLADGPIAAAIQAQIGKVRDELSAMAIGFEGIDGPIARTSFGREFLIHAYEQMQNLTRELEKVEQAVDFYDTAQKLNTAEGRSVALDIVVAKLKRLGITPDFSRP